MNKTDFTEKAQAVMAAAGKSECDEWPEGSFSLSGVSNGGWGNFSTRSRWIPGPDGQTGTILGWDSDDRVWSVTARRVPRPVDEA